MSCVKPQGFKGICSFWRMVNIISVETNLVNGQGWIWACARTDQLREIGAKSKQGMATFDPGHVYWSIALH